MNKQLTIFLRSTLIVLLVFTVTLVQAAVPQGIMEIAGHYVGMAYNGGDLDPVVTVLSFDSQGRFSGSYSVEDENGIFEGRLSGLIKEEGERSFSLEWTDQDGEGFVYLDFSPDYSSFNGVWTRTDGEEQFPWSGRRQ